MATALHFSDVALKRQIGLYAATAITVGNIVGSGIFRSPHSVAQHLTGLPLVIAAWVVGGLLSLCGSLVLAELAAAHPKTGGLYVFIREAFGDAAGFVFGWANLWVIKPTVIASITSVFALYFCQAVGLPPHTELEVGFAAIFLLTLVNWLGVKQGAGTQSVFTTLKMIGIVALCAVAFMMPAKPFPAADMVVAKRASHVAGVAAPAEAGAARVSGASLAADGYDAATVAAPSKAPSEPLLLAFIVAMIPVLFAYDGWTDSTYVGGEIVRPERTLPIAIVWGTVLVIATYVITNLAYYNVLSPVEVAAHEAVGSATVGRLLGDSGLQGLAVLVAVSTFGTINGAILTGPRVTVAMAADGLLWQPLAHVNVRRSSPDRALWLQGVLSCVWLWAAGGFEDVSGWFVTTSWLFYGLTAAALLVQRGREKASGRMISSYRTPLYPLPLWLFVIVTVVLIVSDLGSSGWRAAAGVIVAALGFPVYWFWKGRHAAGASA